MTRTLLSVAFADENKVGRVIVIDGIIERTSYNLRKFYQSDEERFRDWCKNKKLVIEETVTPDVDTHSFEHEEDHGGYLDETYPWEDQSE